MRAPNPSNLPSSHAARVRQSTVFAAAAALPVLLWGLVGCGGSADGSQVTGSGASNSTGHAGGPIFEPPPDSGGASSGTAGTGGTNSGGPYMLPTDFTRAQMGGYKLGPAIDPGGGAGGVGAGTGGNSGMSCGAQILGVVRDFKGNNEVGGHPDFEHFKGSNASVGIVKSLLGGNQRPEYAQTPDGPFIDPANGQQTTDKMHFDEWYRSTATVNKPYVIYFYFQPNAGVLTFQSTAFFPLDGAGWGNTPGAGGHNFGFTTEVHTQFSYAGKETFRFTGDDDLWVFINHQLAIDLGGLHPQASKTISLDDVAQELGISIGGTYDLDLFHAERHTDASNFRVDTNLTFTNCGTIIEEPPVK